MSSVLRKAMRRVRRFVAVAKGRDWYPKVSDAGPTRRIGSAYGGWTVLTSPLEARRPVVLSLGVGEDISFDLGMIEQFQAQVFAYDPTPRCIQWIARQNLPENFRFFPFAVGCRDEVRELYAPPNPAHVSHSIHSANPTGGGPTISVPFKSLAMVYDEIKATEIDILKMDIEGAEYEVLSALVALPVRPRQLLVEFHHRRPPSDVSETKRAVAQLYVAGYRLIHVSETGEEYSFALQSDAQDSLGADDLVASAPAN